MCIFRNPGISRKALKSVFCLALTLSSGLLAESNFPTTNQFAYVADQNTGKISGFIINPANGKLSAIEGSPFTTGNSGSTSVAVDPAGRFLYATNQYGGDNNVAGFRIDGATGKLAPVPGSPFIAGSGPAAVAIDPSGRFVYVANLGSNNVSAFKIDQDNGRLIPASKSPYPAGSFPSSVTVDPLGKFVYVTNQQSSNVSGYTINAVSGALTVIAGSPFAAGYSPMSVAVDPNERFVYVANLGSDDTSGYTLDPITGALTTLATSPYAAGGGGISSVTFDPSGNYLYVAGYGGLFAYSIDQNIEDLRSGGGEFPTDYYGQLTPVPGSPFAGGTPDFVAVDFTGTFLYAANKSSNEITAFTLNSGVLTPLAASPFPGGPGPVSVALVRPRTLPVYATTELPQSQDFGSVSAVTAAGINDRGQVAGTVAFYSGTGETFIEAFIYTGGAPLGLAFSRVSFGYGINDSGQVVGQTELQPPFPLRPPPQAFLYSHSNNSTVDIDNVVGRESAAFGINDAGQVTGSLSTGTCPMSNSPTCLGFTHAFVYRGSGLIDIGTLGGSFSQGSSINRRGEIAGISTVAGSTLNHLFLYDQGHMRDLGTVAGESFASANINDGGEIIGTAVNAANTPASFIYHRGSLEKLPLLASGLNNRGEIVGSATVANGSGHAFLYLAGRLVDLNDLVKPSTSLLTAATGISNNGKIVASGLNGHLYVLTPKYP